LYSFTHTHTHTHTFNRLLLLSLVTGFRFPLHYWYHVYFFWETWQRFGCW